MGNLPILRVFPYRTSYTPDDDMVLISHPLLNEIDGQEEIKNVRVLPPHDEIHISCVFTWDKTLCERLRDLYQKDTDKPVRLGGPAYNSPAANFTQGLYIKPNIIFTSRGCDNACPWCCVPDREGSLRELPITQGNIIQDNNFLQTSREHKKKVFAMLRRQKKICFKGGLESDMIDDYFISAVQGLSIKELWLACDTDESLTNLIHATKCLTKVGFTREHIKCYALIGDDMDANEARLQAIYKAGAMPFAQLYQPFEETKKKYPLEWRKFHRMWSRPAAIKAHVERGTSMWDYRT